MIHYLSDGIDFSCRAIGKLYPLEDTLGVLDAKRRLLETIPCLGNGREPFRRLRTGNRSQRPTLRVDLNEHLPLGTKGFAQLKFHANAHGVAWSFFLADQLLTRLEKLAFMSVIRERILI